jgi:hypothetical protein
VESTRGLRLGWIAARPVTYSQVLPAPIVTCRLNSRGPAAIRFKLDDIGDGAYALAEHTCARADS